MYWEKKKGPVGKPEETTLLQKRTSLGSSSDLPREFPRGLSDLAREFEQSLSGAVGNYFELIYFFDFGLQFEIPPNIRFDWNSISNFFPILCESVLL